MKQIQIDPATVVLVTPVPDAWWPTIWAWMDEYPENNRDDDGPKSWEALADARIATALDGERTFGVVLNGQPVGFISYAPLSHRVAFTRGIVFTKRVHGTGVPRFAVQTILDELWATGIRKLQATHYAHNLQVAGFLRGLGAVEEGCLRDQVTQHGVPVSVKVVAIFAPEGLCR